MFKKIIMQKVKSKLNFKIHLASGGIKLTISPVIYTYFKRKESFKQLSTKITSIPHLKPDYDI